MRGPDPADATAPLLRAVEVMDQLRSPGGCPWDAAQTHESLTRYLLEETYEVLDAIDSGDVTLLREELGDLLLQVLFHARLANELGPGEAFGIDEVAADLVAKLVRRHPHVFAREASDNVESVEALNETWESRKVAEKGRLSAVDGVPIAQPALALTAKLLSRARRAGLAQVRPSAADLPDDSDELGARLFEIVRTAVDQGIDPEAALRRVTQRYRAELLAAEKSRPAPPQSLGQNSAGS